MLDRMPVHHSALQTFIHTHSQHTFLGGGRNKEHPEDRRVILFIFAFLFSFIYYSAKIMWTADHHTSMCFLNIPFYKNEDSCKIVPSLAPITASTLQGCPLSSCFCNMVVNICACLTTRSLVRSGIWCQRRWAGVCHSEGLRSALCADLSNYIYIELACALGIVLLEHVWAVIPSERKFKCHS